ncbi:hypothetical protein DENIS_4953 [Desulfonema ishimotonii]|uniref:Uncharacterized protein n=1 Tax=Desulfonema ishimotonii TaxID=45657 RepID=A0A401G433_9BACT|nr:hypothetical protein DENIS_4953 [Desulfonema ishimotonii]
MGRDLQGSEKSAYLCGFNPRARMGRDSVQPLIARARFLVSIHAPAWGATMEVVATQVYQGGFNPRARMGRDL